MIGKIIVKGKNRLDAIGKMKRALDELIIEGVQTTKPFHEKLLRHETFLDGTFDTGFVDKHFLKS